VSWAGIPPCRRGLGGSGGVSEIGGGGGGGGSGGGGGGGGSGEAAGETGLKVDAESNKRVPTKKLRGKIGRHPKKRERTAALRWWCGCMNTTAATAAGT